MSVRIEKYLDLLSKAFILEEGNVRLNENVQVVATRNLKNLWVLDGLLHCLDLILSEKSIEDAAKGLNYLNEQVDVILNTGHYSDVEDKYRLLYSLVCLCRAFFSCTNNDFEEALKICDDGLLKGLELEEDILAEMSEELCNDLGPLETIKFDDFPMQYQPQPLNRSVQISTVDFPTLETFYRDYFSAGKPVIIRGMVEKWPCFEKWSFDYLDRCFGRRIVPVEIGSRYTDADFSQILMPFHQYLREFIAPAKPEKSGYLAQHRLLDQVKSLRNDVIIPDYCSLTESSESELLNCFIGPCTSVSPLHSDPRHNLFCQIRGQKFVRLVDPKFSKMTYPFDDFLQANSSQIDVESPDYSTFPLFKDVTCEDFIMNEGDCLFIPKRYLHYVRALKPSISVSIWFG